MEALGCAKEDRMANLVSYMASHANFEYFYLGFENREQRNSKMWMLEMTGAL
jgi:hypothetical protein